MEPVRDIVAAVRRLSAAGDAFAGPLCRFAAVAAAFFALAGLPLGAAAQQRAAVAAMDMSKVRQEYGSAAAEGDDVVLHAPAVVRIALDGKAAAFHTQAAIRRTAVGADDPDIMVQPAVLLA